MGGLFFFETRTNFLNRNEMFYRLAFIFVIFYCTLNENLHGQVMDNATVNARVLQAFSTKETSKLNFGNFTTVQVGGKIKISPHGEIKSDGDITIMGINYQSGSIQIAGKDNYMYSINIPNQPITINNSQKSSSMVIDEWEINDPNSLHSGKLENGVQVLNIGATLNIGNRLETPNGLYAGTYSVTIVYN